MWIIGDGDDCHQGGDLEKEMVEVEMMEMQIFAIKVKI